MGGLSTAAIAVSVLLVNDYRNLDRLMFLVLQKVENQITSSREVDALLAEADARIVIYRPYAEHLLGLGTSVTRDGLREKIAATDRLLRYWPSAESLARRALLAALDGDPVAARESIRRMQQFFPRQSRGLVAQLRAMAEKRPDELAGLGYILDEELVRRPQPRW